MEDKRINRHGCSEYTDVENTVHALRWFSGRTGSICDPPAASPNVKVSVCKKCNHFYMDHGYVEGLGFVCPGDYLVFDDEDVRIVPAKDFEAQCHETEAREVT